ncbi:Fimbrin, actin-bundling protein [Orobanche minor]
MPILMTMDKPDPSQKLYNKMRLWEFPDQYVVEPTDGSPASFLAISRLDGSMSVIDDISQCNSPRVPKIQTIYGVVGMLKLLTGKRHKIMLKEVSWWTLAKEGVPIKYMNTILNMHDGATIYISSCGGLIGSYLFVIMERECVGSFLGYPIFKIISMKVFPCDHSVKNSPEEQKKMESEFSRLLSVAERTPGLYFSYDVNITLSLLLCAQRLHDLGDESKLLPLWRQFLIIYYAVTEITCPTVSQADPRFLWNNYMLEVLIDNKLDPYLLPVMQGSFQSFQAAIGKDILDVALIARRCTRRTGDREENQCEVLSIPAGSNLTFSEGTRMWRRGADSDGFVANFVETEQIIQLNGYTASFIQVRGSIPLLWDQIVDLTYKPKFEIVRPEEAPRVVERHFLDLRKKYGNVLAVDLVNKHGGEGRLCEKFGLAMEPVASDDVRYLHFDFHRICGHVHFERLSELYDQIEDFLIKSRYLLLNEKGEKVEGQIGVVRTNCIDCLDRTNVTQSMIARKMLEFQLRRLGVFDAEETISTHPNFDECYKILWANHGDDISIQYSGTPALKGDFVRCGQRTIQGILKDGWNALLRYYLNNFCDGTKQDAIDLLQGHYIVCVSRGMTPTTQKGGIDAIASFPLAVSLIMIGLFFATLSLRRVRHDLWNLLFSFMWASMSLVIAAFVRANGRIFCNRPRLHQPRR